MSSNRAAMEAIVSVRSIPVYGDSTEYPPGQISLKTFMKWAAATRTDLQSYPALNAKLCLLSESITRESMTVLWTCTDLSVRGVPVDYPSDAVRAAATAANLKARSDFHIIWLTEIIAACSPNTNAHIVKMMERIKFGEGATGGITGRFYQEDDVIRYMGKLMQLQRELGDPMGTGLTNKVKLDKSRSPSPEPVQRNRKARRSAGIAKAKPNFDPRPRTSASASRGLQSIKGLTPIKSQDLEDVSESDSESTCSRCSLRGKCPAQDGVCDGQTAEEVD